MSLRTFILVSLTTIPWLAGCGKEPPPPASASLPAVPVKVYTIQDKSHATTEELLGTVRAELRAAIETKVTGRIEKMLAAPGRSFQAGELIAQLDHRDSQARYDQAVAIRDQAVRDDARFQRLIAEKAVTPAEAEAVQSRLQIARTAVAEAEANLAYSTVTAPFAGVITRKLADVGDLALPGRPIAEIEDPTRLQLEASVPENLLNHVHLKDTLPVSIGTLELTGTVSEIVPFVDPATRTFLIKLDLPATPRTRTGQFGHVHITVGETRSPRVPTTAVLRRGQLEFVHIVVSNRAQLRIVRTGKQIGPEVELLAGVQAGEQVALPGDHPLRDGQPVLLQP